MYDCMYATMHAVYCIVFLNLYYAAHMRVMYVLLYKYIYVCSHYVLYVFDLY